MHSSTKDRPPYVQRSFYPVKRELFTRRTLKGGVLSAPPSCELLVSPAVRQWFFLAVEPTFKLFKRLT